MSEAGWILSQLLFSLVLSFSDSNSVDRSRIHGTLSAFAKGLPALRTIT